MARNVRFPALLEFVERSKNYMFKFVDSHCHIDLLYSRYGLKKDFNYTDFKKDHADSYPANYDGCVAIFCDPKSFAPTDPDNVTMKMAASTDNVWLAIGCHPKNATRFTDSHLPSLRLALQNPKVKALGEIGLDYSGTFHEEQQTQKYVLRQQISLALELKLPLVIHCRDADDDCLDILKEMVPRHWPIHRHCFTQDTTIASEWLDAFSNMYLGFTPLITRTSKSVAAVREAAKITPLNRLLLETDAPYFIPNGVRAKLSHPGWALFTAESLADIKDVSVDTVLEACLTNTKNMYNI